MSNPRLPTSVDGPVSRDYPASEKHRRAGDLARGLSRRARRAMSWLGLDAGTSSAEVVQGAVERLTKHLGSVDFNFFAAGGANSDSRDVENGRLLLEQNPPDVFAVSGRAIATLWEYGQTQAALRSAGAIMVHQREDGAFSDRHGRASARTTADVLRGLLAVSGQSRGSTLASRRAAEFLFRWTEKNDAVAADGDANRGRDSTRREPSDDLLLILPSLIEAARAWHEPAWDEVVRRTVQRVRLSCEHTRRHIPLLHSAARIEALLDLNCVDLARLAMKRLMPQQSAAGFVARVSDDSRAAATATARMAALWYRLGQRQRADRAVSWLVRQWRPQRGVDRPHRNAVEDLNAYGLFLHAVRWQVQTLFDGNLQALPEQIDDADGRMQTVHRWLARLPADGRVVDVGCGAGRFLLRMAEARPQMRLAGVDISAAALAKLPAKIETHVGGLLRIPYADGTFDAALAVESLEHALLPSRAVEELCRIVRPGGWVLIIDKNQAFQSRSVHEPWECWFSPRQVTGWLSRSCDHVQVEPIAHGPHARADGLFLAWTARRR